MGGWVGRWAGERGATGVRRPFEIKEQNNSPAAAKKIVPHEKKTRRRRKTRLLNKITQSPYPPLILPPTRCRAQL